MARFDLSEIINGGVPAAEIVPTGELQVLAIDVFEPWAAVFCFSLTPTGRWDTEINTARRDSSGGWDWIGGGGGRGDGWKMPWSRPTNGRPDGHLLRLGECRNDIVDDDQFLNRLVAAYGFASPATQEVWVTFGEVNRTIVPSSTGAFVAVVFGTGYDVKLTPILEGTY